MPTPALPPICLALMSRGDWRGLAFVLLALGLLWVSTRAPRVREAFRLATSKPAFLVPVTMATIGTAALVAQVARHGPHLSSELPWSTSRGTALGIGNPYSWLALALIGVLIAGQIGLLEAWSRGRRPSSGAFLGGIRRHGLTILLGKVVLAAGVLLISRVLAPNGAGLVLYIVPSLFLAPLVGIASTVPGRPLAALRRTLAFTSESLFAVGRFVTWQTLFAVGLLLLWKNLDRSSGDGLDQLCSGASTLSYNPFPYAVVGGAPVPATIMVLLSALASTVFLTAHWLGVTRGYEPAVEPPRQGEDLGQNPPDEYGEGYEYDRS